MAELKKLPPPTLKLTKEAQAHYSAAGKLLIADGVLKVGDIDALSLYAKELAQYERATEELAKDDLVITNPNGSRQINPLRKIADNALKNATAQAERLGLTPKARGMLKAVAAKKQDNDPLDEL